MKTLRPFMLGFALLCLSAGAASADPIGRPDVPPLAAKIDQFAVVTDISGSMMMQSPALQTKKILAAKDLLGRLNARIPGLDYTGALYTVCPTATASAPAAWDRAAFSKAVLDLPADLGIFDRLTDLGGGLGSLADRLPGNRGAVILVTDGWDNIGVDPLAEAQRLANAGTTLHIISFADTAEGKAQIARLAGVNPNTVCVDGAALLLSPVEMDAFIKAVFYEEQEPVVLESVHFATGSYKLDATAQAALDKVAFEILNKPRGVRSVEIEGFTDSVGGVFGGNIALSYNRAFAVREYLVAKGVPVAKIWTKGNSVSYKYNNNTADGRSSNRRADLIIN